MARPLLRCGRRIDAQDPLAPTFAGSLSLNVWRALHQERGPDVSEIAFGSFLFGARSGTSPGMITLDHDGPVARLTLDRPDARNALAIRHWQALDAAIAEVRASPARILLLTGAGGAFCAGADLGEFETFSGDPAARAAFRTAMRTPLEALAALPIATIARIDGPCYGAGVALALACDIRIAAPAARFAVTPAKIGIGYPQEDVARLVAAVGPGQAARILFTGNPIDAGEAMRIGLVEMLGDTGVCDALIADLLSCDGGSIAMLKHGIALAGRGVSSDRGQDDAFDAMLGSDTLAARLSQRRAARGLRPDRA